VARRACETPRPVTEETQAIPDREQPSPQRARRWPALATFVTAGFCPKTTAVRTVHVGYRVAYLVHILAFVLAMLLIVLLEAWDGRVGPGGWQRVLGSAWHTITSLGEEFDRNPLRVTLVVAGTFVGIELAIVAAGLIFVPWGARDEPIRASFGVSIRRTWLYTPHALVLILLPALVIVPVGRAQTAWWVAHRPVAAYPTPPQPPTTQPKDSPVWQEHQAAMAEYDTAVEEYSEAWDEHWASRPWHVQYAPAVIWWSMFAAGIWCLWAWLRTVGAPRPVTPPEHAPLCEVCGYNLTGTHGQGRCPECGDAVAASLGPGVRPGAFWQRRAKAGRWYAWRRCSIEALRRPRSFGRSLQLRTPTTAHRGFLAMHLPLAFVVACLGSLATQVADNGLSSLSDSPELLLAIGPALGSVTVLVVLAISLLTAAVVGVWYQVTDKRNLLAASMQGAAYSSGYLVLWAAVMWTLIVVFTVAEDAIEQWIRSVGMFAGFLMVAGFWVIVNLLLLLGYFCLVLRITSAARYANR